ncbi:hypothetical protein EJB05_25155, partial [Eragrostis curvula]
MPWALRAQEGHTTTDWKLIQIRRRKGKIGNCYFRDQLINPSLIQPAMYVFTGVTLMLQCLHAKYMTWCFDS